MAAVLPFLESGKHHFSAEDKEFVENAPDGLGSLGAWGKSSGLGAVAKPRFGDEFVAASHNELVQLLWMRRAIEHAVRWKDFYAEKPQHPRGFQLVKEGRDWWIVFDEPIPRNAVPWSFADKDIVRVSLLSTNSKMACPTYDLPAGAMNVGGSCPGAVVAQSTSLPRRTDEELLRYKIVEKKGSKFVLRVLPGIEYSYDKTVCSRCVSGDTRVLVRGHGIVRIDALVGKGTFEVWSGKGWRKTYAVHNGRKRVGVLRTSWGAALKLTEDHEVLTRAGMVEAGDLRPGDTLVHEMPEINPFPERAPLVTAAGSRGEKRHYNAVTESFPKEWSYSVGVLLGYVLGDGTVSSGPYPTVRILASIPDKSDLDRLNDVVKSWCGTETEVKVKKTQPNRITSTPADMAHVAWRMRGLYEFLRDCGLDKTLPIEQRRAPAGLWSASREAVRGFISGMFSTDGSVLVNEKGLGKVEVTLASVSEGLIQDVQQMLLAFGIRSNFCKYEKSSREREVVGYKPLWKLNIGAAEHVERFFDRIGFFNERKQKRLSDALHICRRKVPVNRFPKVKSVGPFDTLEEVYDLVDVGEEHQFVANGISISNCYASGAAYTKSSIQAAEVVHLLVTQQMLDTPATANIFADIMADAIVSTNWDSGDYKRRVTKDGTPVNYSTRPRSPAGGPVKPVRVHSSGDFYNQKYAAWWIDVANKVHAIDRDVVLWASTRTHVVPGWVDFWKGATARLTSKKSFIIRPSAYQIGDPAPPKLGGLTGAGTSVLFEEEVVSGKGPKYDWNCQTYVSDADDKTCAIATAPDEEPGCRACWVHPDARINYVAH